MAVVTHKTNRVDLLARAVLGDDSDAARRRIIRFNAARFAAKPTFWLDEHEFIWTKEPDPPHGRTLFVGPNLALRPRPGQALVI